VEREAADSEIKARLLANDFSALDMIWDQYAADLLGYLTGILCSRHEAEDALQEVFITISEKRASVAEARLLGPYLFRLSRNTALNRIKKNRRIREREHEASHWLLLDAEDEGSDERLNQVEAALATLPEVQRSVIVLKFYQEKTFQEIGKMLNISENTAASRYRYAIDKIRTFLKEVL
jgi:RNA polymerase sigma-70 factor (ECF subfamily)